MGEIIKKEKQELKVKLSLTKKDYEFLENYARFHNKQKAMELSGLDLKPDGTKYKSTYIDERANRILRNPEAQEFMKVMHDDTLKNACLDYNRAMIEAYHLFIELKESKKFREANIAFNTYLQLAGFINSKQAVNVNTQIVSDGQSININYIQPPKKDDV